MSIFYDNNLQTAFSAIEDRLKSFFEVCFATEYFDRDLDHKYTMTTRESRINALINEGIVAKAEYLFLKDAQKLKEQGAEDVLSNIVKITSNNNPIIRIGNAVLCNFDALTPKLCEHLNIYRPTRSNTDGKIFNGREIEAYLDDVEQMINDFGEIDFKEFTIKYKTPSKYTYCSNIFKNEQTIENTKCSITEDETEITVFHIFNDMADSIMILNQIAESEGYSTGFGRNSLSLKAGKEETYISQTRLEIKYALENNHYVPKDIYLKATCEDDDSQCILSPIYQEHLVGETKFYFEKYVENFNNKIIYEIKDEIKKADLAAEKRLNEIINKVLSSVKKNESKERNL